jgi:hypothetical protein
MTENNPPSDNSSFIYLKEIKLAQLKSNDPSRPARKAAPKPVYTATNQKSSLNSLLLQSL